MMTISGLIPLLLSSRIVRLKYAFALVLPGTLRLPALASMSASR